MTRPNPIQEHVGKLLRCDRCPRMNKPVVAGRPVAVKVMLIGQAPGDKEPIMGRPFAWTAGKTLFRWFQGSLGWSEDEVRERIYFAAVCRCFPGKLPQGGDRVPAPDEIENCRFWMQREFELLQPSLVIPVGKLAISRFLEPAPLQDIIGRAFKITLVSGQADCIPLPHPSGASPWHRMEPGKSLLTRGLGLIAAHPAIAGRTLTPPRSLAR